jgi:hypothetical protein
MLYICPHGTQFVFECCCMFACLMVLNASFNNIYRYGTAVWICNNKTNFVSWYLHTNIISCMFIYLQVRQVYSTTNIEFESRSGRCVQTVIFNYWQKYQFSLRKSQSYYNIVYSVHYVICCIIVYSVHCHVLSYTMYVNLDQGDAYNIMW